jgi:hypothetical protein
MTHPKCEIFAMETKLVAASDSQRARVELAAFLVHQSAEEEAMIGST